MARCRLLDALTLAPAILDVDPRNVFVRVRRHGKGGSQYANEAAPFSAHNRSPRHKQGAPVLPPGAHLIEEGGLIFEVNFSQRLDCGIFLDHRDTRSMLREMAKQTKGSKRFLNLFAYTGTATCYAADGGMIHTTTVDLSRPSLDWARRNMERNGFEGREHEYVQADVISWIGEQRHTRNRWDLIFCDVPTFSNSSRMRNRNLRVLVQPAHLRTRRGEAQARQSRNRGHNRSDHSRGLRTQQTYTPRISRAALKWHCVTFARMRTIYDTISFSVLLY